MTDGASAHDDEELNDDDSLFGGSDDDDEGDDNGHELDAAVAEPTFTLALPPKRTFLPSLPNENVGAIALPVSPVVSEQSSTVALKKRPLPSTGKDKEPVKKRRTTSQQPTPPQPPPSFLPLPSQGPIPKNFLRSQKALLGVAGIVAGVAPHRSAQEGTSQYCPIILEDDEDEDMATPGSVDNVTSDAPNRYPASPCPTEPPSSDGEQGHAFPSTTVEKKLKFRSRGPAIPTRFVSFEAEMLSLLPYDLDLRNTLRSLVGLHAAPIPPEPTPEISTTQEPPAKRRRVPAHAEFWDVPFPFPPGEAPPGYLATWTANKKKRLISEIITKIKRVVAKAEIRRRSSLVVAGNPDPDGALGYLNSESRIEVMANTISTWLLKAQADVAEEGQKKAAAEEIISVAALIEALESATVIPGYKPPKPPKPAPPPPPVPVLSLPGPSVPKPSTINPSLDVPEKPRNPFDFSSMDGPLFANQNQSWSSGKVGGFLPSPPHSVSPAIIQPELPPTAAPPQHLYPHHSSYVIPDSSIDPTLRPPSNSSVIDPRFLTYTVAPGPHPPLPPNALHPATHPMYSALGGAPPGMAVHGLSLPPPSIKLPPSRFPLTRPAVQAIPMPPHPVNLNMRLPTAAPISHMAPTRYQHPSTVRLIPPPLVKKPGTKSVPNVKEKAKAAREKLQHEYEAIERQLWACTVEEGVLKNLIQVLSSSHT